MATMDDIRSALQTAVAYQRAGQLPQAEALYRQALAVAPDNPDLAQAYCNLGFLLSQSLRHQEAIVHYKKAVALKPEIADAHFYLAMSSRALGDFETALTESRIALQFDPNHWHALTQLAAMLTDIGEIDAAIDIYRRLLRLDPTLSGAHSNILFALHCLPRISPQTLFDEHLRFGALHTDSIQPIGHAPDIDRDPNRRLRIGYCFPRFSRTFRRIVYLADSESSRSPRI